jgi:hypothetical protein
MLAVIGFLLVVMAVWGLAWLWRIFRRDGLFWVAWVSPKSLRKQQCQTCTGWGAQWLDPDRGWAAIPKHMRSHKHGQAHGRIQAKLANQRNCPVCHGLGHTWHKKPEAAKGRMTWTRL